MEYLDAVVVAVGHGNGAVGAEGEAVGIIEPARGSRSRRPIITTNTAKCPVGDLEVERAVGVEDLDAVVGAVGHGHDPAGAEVDAGSCIKLALAISRVVQTATTTLPDPIGGDRAVGGEDVDVVAGQVGHGHDPAGAECNRKWQGKIAIIQSILRKLKGKYGPFGA